MTTTAERRPLAEAAHRETVDETTPSVPNPPDGHHDLRERDWHTRFDLCILLNERQKSLLRAMAGTGPCRYFPDASCLMCSGLSLAQLAAAVALHGSALRRYGRDVEAIRDAIQRVAVAWMGGRPVG